MSANPLDSLPLPFIFVGFLALFAAAYEAGYRFGWFRQPGTDTTAEVSKSQASTVLGAILALVSFLLAFTFGMASSQYDARRRLAIDDLNAIGTTFLRTAHLQEPHRTNARRLLEEYVKVSIDMDTGDFIEFRARSEVLHEQLWAKRPPWPRSSRTRSARSSSSRSIS